MSKFWLVEFGLVLVMSCKHPEALWSFTQEALGQCNILYNAEIGDGAGQQKGRADAGGAEPRALRDSYSPLPDGILLRAAACSEAEPGCSSESRPLPAPGPPASSRLALGASPIGDPHPAAGGAALGRFPNPAARHRPERRPRPRLRRRRDAGAGLPCPGIERALRRCECWSFLVDVCLFFFFFFPFQWKVSTSPGRGWDKSCPGRRGDRFRPPPPPAAPGTAAATRGPVPTRHLAQRALANKLSEDDGRASRPQPGNPRRRGAGQGRSQDGRRRRRRAGKLHSVL